MKFRGIHKREICGIKEEYHIFFPHISTIRVSNQEYNYVKEDWKQAIGKAKFTGDDNVAMLKVSFFSSFHSGYNVIALDDDYQYALVVGKNLKYLRILARGTTIPDEVKERYLQIAEEIGYDTSELIRVEL